MSWLRRMLWFLVAAAGVYFLYAPLLRALGERLVADEISPRPAAAIVLRTDDGFTPDGQNAYRMAAELYRESPTRQVLLLLPATPRVVAIGAVPSFEATTRRILARYGVPDRAIRVIDAGTTTLYQDVRALNEWMQKYPDVDVVWLCDRFSSARERSVIDRLLQIDVANRIHLRALPNRLFDEHNWWCDREGVKAFMFATLDLGYCRWHGERAHTGKRWSPDEYERQLIAARGGAKP